MILPGETGIGILGDGQLGRMLALAAQQMGYGVCVFGPGGPSSPAGQVASRCITAAYDDKAALHTFEQIVDVITYEFENVLPAAEFFAEWPPGPPLCPGLPVLLATGNRLREKEFLRRAGCATAPFAPVREDTDLADAAATAGLPAVLKTAGSGYDGKGQRVVHSEAELRAAWDELERVECILEGFVDFAFEASVVAARGEDGSYRDYGLVRNEHSHHILDVTTAPAPGVPPALARQASDTTRAILEALQVVGVLCVEFFVTHDGQLLVNECAPRPHNSGHFTIDACVTSQFEQQLRAVCGLPLGDTRMLGPAAMANLLGDVWRNGDPDWAGMLRDFPDAKLHLYGKVGARNGRKMGHVTVLGDTPEEAALRVRAARDRLTGQNGYPIP